MVDELDQRLIVTADCSVVAGRRGMAQLLDRGPDIDAVFAASDLIAAGAIQAIQQ